jgi:nucleotide-binding universal stress UspA family protein
MSKIIVCVDGSDYQQSICDLSSWVNKNTNFQISLLHVAVPHDGVEAKGNFSGSIGLGAAGGLLEELSEQDEAHGKMEQHKGEEILDNASKSLSINNVQDIQRVHRRGTLIQTVSELESEAKLIVIGKKGEENHPTRIGANLEGVIRNTSKPLLLATRNIKPIKKFLIAYDGSEAANKALEYVISSKLLKDLDCHILKVEQKTGKAIETLTQAELKLSKAGFKVTSSLKASGSIQDIVLSYVKENDIDLLVIGAYGHSKIRNFIMGSTTTALISKAEIPTLLFR